MSSAPLGTPGRATSEGGLSKTTLSWRVGSLPCAGVSRGIPRLEFLWLELLCCLLEHLAMSSVRAWCGGRGECRGVPEGWGWG